MDSTRHAVRRNDVLLARPGDGLRRQRLRLVEHEQLRLRHDAADREQRHRLECERRLQGRPDDPRPGRLLRAGQRDGQPEARAEHDARRVGDLRLRLGHLDAHLRLHRPGRRQRRRPRLHRHRRAHAQRRHIADPAANNATLTLAAPARPARSRPTRASPIDTTAPTAAASRRPTRTAPTRPARRSTSRSASTSPSTSPARPSSPSRPAPPTRPPATRPARGTATLTFDYTVQAGDTAPTSTTTAPARSPSTAARSPTRPAMTRRSRSPPPAPPARSPRTGTSASTRIRPVRRASRRAGRRLRPRALPRAPRDVLEQRRRRHRHPRLPGLHRRRVQQHRAERSLGERAHRRRERELDAERPRRRRLLLARSARTTPPATSPAGRRPRASRSTRRRRPARRLDTGRRPPRSTGRRPSPRRTRTRRRAATPASLVFEVCTTNACTTVLRSTTVAGLHQNDAGSWTPPGLGDGIYYWHVRAED